MPKRIPPELARHRLTERRARLARLKGLDAPDIVIESEERLIRRALYELETGFEAPPEVG